MLCLGGQQWAQAQRGPGAAPSRGPGWLPRELQIPELANPEGFEIEPAFYGGNDPGATGRVIGSRFTLMFYAPSRKIAGEGNDCIRVNLNYLYGANLTPCPGQRTKVPSGHWLHWAIGPGPASTVHPSPRKLGRESNSYLDFR